MAKIDVNVPDIGDFKDVPVIEVLVKPGDVVKAEQSLVTLESDKATMDVPSPIAGAVAEVVAKVGDKVSMGTLIARIDTGAGESARAAAPAKSAPAPAKAAPAAPAKAAPAAPTKSAAAPASPKTATIDITVPDIGDFKDVPVIEVLVKAGDTVEAEQPLVTLESDKATMDVPSPAAGKIIQLIAKVGDKVSMGALIAKLDAGGPAAPVRLVAGKRGAGEGGGGRRPGARNPARRAQGSAARAQPGFRARQGRLLRRLRRPGGSSPCARARS